MHGSAECAATGTAQNTNDCETSLKAAANERGRDMSKPSGVPMSSRFLQTTQSASVKQRLPTRASPERQRSKSAEKKLTIPVAPKLRCVSRSRDRVQSTEEREQQQIEEAKAAEETRRRRNQRSMQYNKAKSSMPVHNVVRSTKQLTIPTTPFHHMVKRHGEKKCSTTYVSKPELRPKSAPTAGPRALTQPQPFTLHTEARAGAVQHPAETVLTAGELCRQFESDPRSHRVPAASVHLTEAMSPKLSTKMRASSTGRTRPKSREEMEVDAVAEASKHPFKAKPVDKRIFSSLGELGVPKVAAKPATTCEEFTFHYNEERAAQRLHKAELSDSSKTTHFHFKANPMPDFASSSIPAHVSITRPLTVACSPKLAGGRRSSSAPPRRQLPHHDEVAKDLKAKDAEDRARNLKRLRLTEPEEFRLSTNERGLIARQMFNRKLQEEITQEKRKRNFKAQHVNFDKGVFMPQPSKKELTDFKAFHLQTDDRHAVAASRLAKDEEIRCAKEIEDMHFHARPMPKATNDPTAAFKVHKDGKPVTRPEAISFATDERVNKRKIFEKELARKRKAQADQLHILEQEKEKSDIENLNMLRRRPIEEGGLCFKAAPYSALNSGSTTKHEGHGQKVLNQQSLNSLICPDFAEGGL